MMGKNNAFKKTKITIGIGLLIAGAMSSAIVGINYFNAQQFKYYDLGKFSWNSRTNAQDVVNAINDNENLISFKNESLDFLRAKIYTYDLRVLGMSIEAATNEANATAQKYEEEFNDIVSKYFNEDYFAMQKNSLTSPFTDVYSKLMELNKKFNIDPIDYHQFKDVLLPQVEERILNNVSVKERTEYARKFNFLENNARDKILNSHLNSFQLNNFLAANLNEEGLSEDKEIELVSIEVTKMIVNKTLIINENPDFDFIGSLAPYSVDGKTGYKNTDILEPNDLNKLFLAKRDYLGNSPLLSPDKQTSQDIDASTIHESKQEYLPLDTYIPSTEGLSRFEQNEITPGYTLHAKIINIDYATNSEKAKVSFQLGISKTDDVNKKILWISSTDENVDNNYLSHDFILTSFEQKFNCANNFFYPNKLKLAYSSKNFDARDIANRTTITALLHKAPTDENDYYLFDEEHPYLVDIDGAELPGIAKPKQLENKHKNEKTMLAITGVNTNFTKFSNLDQILANKELVNSTDPYRFKNLIPYVEAKWVLADTIPNSDEYEIIKEFEWTQSEETVNSLPLYFPYANDELILLQQANVTTKFIHDLYILAYDENGNEVNVASDIYYNMNLTAGIDWGLTGLLIISTTVNDILACVSAFTILSLGSDIICSVLDGYLAYSGALTAAAKNDILPSVQDVVDLVEKFKELIPQDLAKTYAELYKKLNDEKVSVDAKLRIALVSKNYIYDFCEEIFVFLEYASVLTHNPEFMNKEKKWADYFKKDTISIRSFLNSVGNIQNTTETKEFLNYHNDNIIDTYGKFEKGDIAAISGIDQGMIYEFKLHRAYFDVFGVIAVGKFLISKILTMTGTQIILWTNIVSNNETSQEQFFLQRTLSESSSNHSPLVSRNDSDVVEELLQEQDRQTDQHIADINDSSRGSVSDNSEFRDFKERNARNTMFGKAMLITGLIIVVVGVVQIIVDSTLPAIPEDKKGIIEQMQAEL